MKAVFLSESIDLVLNRLIKLNLLFFLNIIVIRHWNRSKGHCKSRILRQLALVAKLTY